MLRIEKDKQIKLKETLRCSFTVSDYVFQLSPQSHNNVYHSRVFCKICHLHTNHSFDTLYQVFSNKFKYQLLL